MKTLTGYTETRCRKCKQVNERKFDDRQAVDEKEARIVSVELVMLMNIKTERHVMLLECKNCEMYTLQDFLGCKVIDNESGTFIGNLMKYLNLR